MLVAVEFFEQLARTGDWLERVWPVFVVLAASLGMGHKITTTIVNDLDQRIDSKMDTKLAPITSELRTNGGSSLRDAVNRIETKAATAVQYSAENAQAVQEVARLANEAVVVSSVNKSRLDAVVSSLHHVAYYEMNAQGTVTYVNDAYLNLFEMSTEEALHSTKWRDRISSADLDQIDRSGALAQANHTEWQSEFTVLRSEGPIKVTDRAKPLFRGDEFIGFSGAMSF